MRTGMIALALGLLTLRFLPALPPVWLLILMPIVGLMVLPFRAYPLAFFLFGFTWACTQAQWALSDRLPIQLEGETRWVEGTVTGLPQNGEGVVRFELSDSHSRRTKLPQRMRLRRTAKVSCALSCRTAIPGVQSSRSGCAWPGTTALR